MIILEVDAAVNLSAHTYKHRSGLKACGMGKHPHVAEVAHHDEITVESHQFGDVLLKEMLDRDVGKSLIHCVVNYKKPHKNNKLPPIIGALIRQIGHLLQ